MTTFRLAKELEFKTQDLMEKLPAMGLLEGDAAKPSLADAGKTVSGKFRYQKKFGPYFLWLRDLNLD